MQIVNGHKTTIHCDSFQMCLSYRFNSTWYVFVFLHLQHKMHLHFVIIVGYVRVEVRLKICVECVIEWIFLFRIHGRFLSLSFFLSFRFRSNSTSISIADYGIAIGSFLCGSAVFGELSILQENWCSIKLFSERWTMINDRHKSKTHWLYWLHNRFDFVSWIHSLLFFFFPLSFTQLEMRRQTQLLSFNSTNRNSKKHK